MTDTYTIACRDCDEIEHKRWKDVAQKIKSRHERFGCDNVEIHEGELSRDEAFPSDQLLDEAATSPRDVVDKIRGRDDDDDDDSSGTLNTGNFGTRLQSSGGYTITIDEDDLRDELQGDDNDE